MQFGGGGVAMGDDGFLPHGDAFHGFQGTLGAASGAYLRPSAALPSASGPGTFDEYANEPPLLEELGVNFSAIGTKTTAVLMLHRPISPEVLLDADLAGPLVFCVVLGLCLLLSGKLHFGYIYGFGLLGCCGMYMLVNLMQGVEGAAPAGAEGSAAAAAAAAAAADGSASAPARLGLTLTVSMLGYCLLPIVLLAALAVFFNLHGLHGMVLGVAAILWSTLSCARFFEVALRMSDRKWLIAYPAGLFYACFALMAIF